MGKDGEIECAFPRLLRLHLRQKLHRIFQIKYAIFSGNNRKQKRGWQSAKFPRLQSQPETVTFYRLQWGEWRWWGAGALILLFLLIGRRAGSCRRPTANNFSIRRRHCRLRQCHQSVILFTYMHISILNTHIFRDIICIVDFLSLILEFNGLNYAKFAYNFA